MREEGAIYCPWLIHSKCAEPSASRVGGRGWWLEGGRRKREARGLLGLSAGLL